MNPDQYILALLSEGPKRWTELDAKLSTYKNPKGICARQTLVAHLESLVGDKKIRKDPNPKDRSVTYSLMPAFTSSAKSAMDIITLELLMNELEYKTRKDLTLEKAEPDRAIERSWLEDLSVLFGVLPNKPRARFVLRLDKDTMRMTDLIQPTSEMASELEGFIKDRLNQMKQKIPATIQDELVFVSENAKDWNEIMDFSGKVAKKHGFRFLVASWYDGRDYGERILSAIKNLERLQRRHEDDCSFLDEVNKRCFYSYHEYYWEDPIEIYPFETIPTISNSTLLKDGFILHLHKEQELMMLETALISASPAAKLPKDLFKEDIGYVGAPASKKVHSPYSILTAQAYVKMKLPFLGEGEKKSLIKDLLRFLKGEEAETLSIDYHRHPEDYRLAIDLLAKKLNIDLDTDKEENINSPVMNFQFYDGHTLVDFSDDPLVRNFLKFQNNSEKRKWLQKCLLQGLPIFFYIPLGKLGFEVRRII